MTLTPSDNNFSANAVKRRWTCAKACIRPPVRLGAEGIQNPPGTKIADIERKMVELAREARTLRQGGPFFCLLTFKRLEGV